MTNTKPNVSGLPSGRHYWVCPWRLWLYIKAIVQYFHYHTRQSGLKFDRGSPEPLSNNIALSVLIWWIISLFLSNSVNVYTVTLELTLSDLRTSACSLFWTSDNNCLIGVFDIISINRRSNTHIFLIERGYAISTGMLNDLKHWFTDKLQLM